MFLILQLVLVQARYSHALIIHNTSFTTCMYLATQPMFLTNEFQMERKFQDGSLDLIDVSIYGYLPYILVLYLLFAILKQA